MTFIGHLKAAALAPPPLPEERVPSTENRANLLSKLFFSWAFSIIQTAGLRRLELNDFPLLNPDRTSRAMSNKVRHNLDHHIASGSRYPLLRAVEQSCRFNLILALLLDIASIVIDYATVVAFYFLFRYFHDGQDAVAVGRQPPSFATGVIWIGIIVAAECLIAFCRSHAHYRSEIIGAEIRTALVCVLSDKSFTIDPTAPVVLDGDDDETRSPSSSNVDRADRLWDSASITTLTNLHTERFAEIFTNAIIVIRSLVNLPLLTGVLAWVLNPWLAIVMLVIISLCYCASFLPALRAIKARRRANVHTDDRASQLSDMLSGIRLIKFFGWEERLFERITATRTLEVDENRNMIFWSSLLATISGNATFGCPLVCYAVYASQNSLLNNPALVLSGIVFLILDRNAWPMVESCANLFNAWPAINRIEKFLLAKDRIDHHIDNMKPEAGFAVRLDSALFAWKVAPDTSSIHFSAGVEKTGTPDIASTNSATDFSMAPIALSIKPRELVAVVGPMQAGKSSLLYGLIGEMPLRSGSLAIDGIPSYCPQDPWVQSTTLRANILFGQRHDTLLYDRVLDACALKPDLVKLTKGDLSELGERGVNLSGGQKARLHLARTLYQALKDDRRVVLLDDPLAAVDARTANSIFDVAILDLLQDKACILVTHQLHVLSRCDRVIYMKHGQTQADGSFDDLMRMPEFATFIGQQRGDHDELIQERLAGRDEEKMIEKSIVEDADEVLAIEDEERAAYRVPWRFYLASLGDFRSRVSFVLINLNSVAAQCLFGFSQLLLAWWSANTFHLGLTTYVGIFIVVVVVNSAMWGAYAYLIQAWCLQRSDCYSRAALDGLLRAPLSFFASNPTGRLLNRFIHDVSYLDTVLPVCFWLLGMVGAFMITTLIIVVIYIPLVATLLLPWICFGLLIFKFYKAAPLETKRLSVNMSAVFLSCLREGLSGRTTITLAKQQEAYGEVLHDQIDEFNSVNFIAVGTYEWAVLTQDLSYMVMMFCSGLLLIHERLRYAPAILTFVFAYFSVTGTLLQELLQNGTKVQRGVNATERLEHFSHNLADEGERHGAGTLLGKKHDWPNKGAISFRNVHLQYKPGLPMALSGLDLDIKAREKIGIVGRTGAGKSTLLMALLRLVPLSQGNVVIDDVDISKVGLYDVRHNIAAIPQDPTLFLGTVQFNLDPTQSGELSDERLVETLEQVHLTGKTAQGDKTITLDTMVMAGGENFSSGERQMLSLARALAKKSKILIMDEATSNVDLAKDDLVQRTIREAFADCTVITIAHRLRTVLQYDRICVMDDGKVAELGPPRELYQRRKGLFRALCDQAQVSLADFGDDDVTDEKNRLG